MHTQIFLNWLLGWPWWRGLFIYSDITEVKGIETQMDTICMICLKLLKKENFVYNYLGEMFIETHGISLAVLELLTWAVENSTKGKSSNWY